MTSKTSKAPSSGAGGALGNAYHCQAISTRDIPLSLTEIQSRHLAHRFGIRADRARLVAPFAFGGGAT